MYNSLKDRCYRIKDRFLYKVFTKFGIAEFHTIIYFLIHNKEYKLNTKTCEIELIEDAL